MATPDEELLAAQQRAIAYLDPGKSGYAESAYQIQQAKSIADLQEILDPIIGQTASRAVIGATEVEPEDVQGAEGVPGAGGVYVPDSEEVDAYVAKAEAETDVSAFADKLIAADIGFDESDLIAVYESDDIGDAVKAAHAAAEGNKHQHKAIVEAEPDIATKARVDAVFSSAGEEDNASKENLRDWGYGGEFADNHDEMIQQGWNVKVDADNNIFYIDESKQVMDIEGKNVGFYDTFLMDIDFREHLPDPRRPIGMPAGSYIAEGSNVNLVRGRPEVSLSAWYAMYGDDYVDSVDQRDFDDVLEASGVSRTAMSIRSLLSRSDNPFFTETTELHYQYLEGDQVNQFIDMPLEDFGAWQERYSDAGIYKIGKLGSFDPKFSAINNAVMQSANHNYEGDPNGMRKAWDDMAGNPQLLENVFGSGATGGRSTTSRIWRPPAYLSPDYADLSQAVKATFEQKLGRAPSDAEIALLSTKMKSDHRGEFDAQAQAQKMQFFASGGDSAGTVQDVSYAARFQEDFEDRYQDEVGTLDKIDMSRNMTQQALGSILSADRAIGY